MLRACEKRVPLRENPGIALGATLGELALHGRDKVTFVTPPELASFGMWLEQLLAESTGKAGTGLLPVAGEAIGPPGAYGNDRVFVHLGWDQEEAGGDEQAAAVDALAAAGHPVIRIRLRDRLDLGGEFVRWEIATATAGAVLGINPFDQPNVQESKDNTRRILAETANNGGLPQEEPSLEADGLRVYGADHARTLAAALETFLGQAHAGDYLALLAYLPPDGATDEVLSDLRTRVRARLHVATTAGYGPRYLHSTGQLHKGGPATGLYLMLTAHETPVLDVPGRKYDFGTLQLAQAIGDQGALRTHERRVLRIHLDGDVSKGLRTVRDALPQSLEALT